MTDGDQARAIVIEGVEARCGAAERVDRGEVHSISTLPRHYFAGVSTQDLRSRDNDQLFGALRSHWRFALTRNSGHSIVRAFSPDAGRNGWDAPVSVLQIVTDDAPFLVDSVAMATRRVGLGIELVIHPVLWVRRNGDGVIETLSDSEDPLARPESFMHFELERTSDDTTLRVLEREVQMTLANVHAGVDDWQLLRARTTELAVEVLTQPPGIADAADREEAAALLQWMADNHFIILGAADFVIGPDGLERVSGSGLGVMRDAMNLAFRASDDWAPAAVVLLTKTEIASVIHRPTPYDIVGIKRYDSSGHLFGERRVMGLFTSEAYLSSPTTIPVLRRKVDEVLARSGFNPRSHDGKELRAVLAGYPRDELFAASVDQLHDTAMGVVQLQERRRVRLFVRRDVHRRVWTALVYLPRDRYNTEVRHKLENALMRAFDGASIEFTVSLTESSLARIHFVIHLSPMAGFRDVAVEQVEEYLTDSVRSWGDALRDALVDQCGDEHGRDLYLRYADVFPPGFTAVTAARLAVPDVINAERVVASSELEVHVQIPLDAPAGVARLKVYVPGTQIDLADLLPLLANLGVRVLDERATELSLAPQSVWIHDLGVTCMGVDLAAAGVDERLQDAFVAAWRGRSQSDGFNRLVLHAGLTWREVHVLRAYVSYLRQLAFTFSQGYVETTLLEQAEISSDLVGLFRTKFDPTNVTDRGGTMDTVRSRILHRLDTVASLDQDRIIRALLGLIEATVRTNWFQLDATGSYRPTLTFKLEPALIADAPPPRPQFEIYVNSPLVEGVHLRMGPVARGGIRWSERPEDFRTEVLGLMKAQAVKNAVIVPAGAKGGFVVRRTFTDRQAMQDEVVACYRLFIESLLELTDNLVGTTVVPPELTVRHDGDDSYLVVAADKGTATFSDIANELALRRGFWLGDAFASGGSVGYDHKAMGITARGAWESVKKHLRRLGRGADEPIRVVGIGDMSGDVFGNGMLLSTHIELVGAFDHRHVFIDPTPDHGATFGERARLFVLPRSSWDDFDRAVMSPGGGVWPRTAKSIALSAEACAALGIDGPVVMTPLQVIGAMLKAPVDLLWNGGIGTYVKASTESHAEAGDRANDGLRADASELRCRIVGEGGNLGLTQRARIEFARRGGLINTDAIDNSAGVDTSDHEVNLKILLDSVVANGDLTVKQRNAVLVDMTEDVGRLVLADNIDQNQALVNGVTLAPAMLDVHARYLSHLEQVARLDRGLEALPDTDALLERKAQGAGLTAPELAVLLAYTKLHLSERLRTEGGSSDPAFRSFLVGYFPPLVQERFASQLGGHPLAAEITATAVVNEMVNHNGVTFAFRLSEETQASVSDITRAHLAATQLLSAHTLWDEICALSDAVPDAIQTQMLLEIDRLVERASRWVLRNRRLPIDVVDTVDTYHDGVQLVAGLLDQLASEAERHTISARRQPWVEAGVPEVLADRVAGLELLPSALDIVRLSLQGGWAVEDVAGAYFTLDDRLRLGQMREAILGLARDDRWDALARAALRDDLAGEHASLTASVLATAPDRAVSDRFQMWVDEHRAAVDRHLTLTTEVEESGAANVATMSVVLRQLRTLALFP